jgi:hypothetical protein
MYLHIPSAREKPRWNVTARIIDKLPTHMAKCNMRTRQGKITPSKTMTHNAAGQEPLSPCLVEWQDPAWGGVGGLGQGGCACYCRCYSSICRRMIPKEKERLRSRYQELPCVPRQGNVVAGRRRTSTLNGQGGGR